MADTTWTSPRRLYLDKQGKVVEENDPTRASLLVAAGGSIPLEQARALGLLEEAKVAPAAIDTKLRPGPAENKALGEGEGTPEQLAPPGAATPTEPAGEPAVTFDPAPAFEQAVEERQAAGVPTEETPKRGKRG